MWPSGEVIRLTCERCRRRIRYATPDGRVYEFCQRLADIDEDICDHCEDDVIAACEAYRAA